MSSSNSDRFNSSFPIWNPFISFLVWLLSLGLPILCWIQVAGVAFLSCSWSWKTWSQLSTPEYNVSCGLEIYSLYYVKACSSYIHFAERFFHKWLLNFVKNFFCMYWDDHMVYILQFANVVNHWFVDSKPFLCLWEKSQFIMMYDAFNVFLNSVC